MRKGRPKVALILTTEERQPLHSVGHRSRSAAALARRARIIMNELVRANGTVLTSTTSFGTDCSEVKSRRASSRQRQSGGKCWTLSVRRARSRGGA